MCDHIHRWQVVKRDRDDMREIHHLVCQDCEQRRNHVHGCYDCGRPYGPENGFPDLVVLPHSVWNDILSPTGDEGGLLCPSCMCLRAHMAGLTGVHARFTSGPFAPPEPFAEPIEDGQEEARLRAIEAHVRRFVDPEPGVYGDLDEWHRQARALLGLPEKTSTT